MLRKFKQSRLLIGFVSFFSVALASSAPFERNPQSCGMITNVRKRRQNQEQVTEDNDQLKA